MGEQGINKRNERLNEIRYNNKKELMKIIEYNNANDIVVEFQDKYKAKKRCAYKEFKLGKVKNPYDKEVLNVGYLGEGKYSHKEHPHIWKVWHYMIRRCYDAYHINKYLAYKDVYVCDEWHCFQNFAKWFEDNYYECNNEHMHLDKDILIKGNKIYSPNTCIFVPERINYLFLKSNRARGLYPIGVSYHKKAECYTSRCSILNKEGKKNEKHLGTFDNEIDAFLTYKQFKENYIKQVADEYKDLIPEKLYDAMYNYKVEIND